LPGRRNWNPEGFHPKIILDARTGRRTRKEGKTTDLYIQSNKQYITEKGFKIKRKRNI
jgi:hypothetical protein